MTRVAEGACSKGGSAYTAVHGPAGCFACGAHSIRTDAGGSVWIVDAGAHVAYKSDTNGRPLLELRTRHEAGTDQDHFNLPTDVAFDPDGSIYVTDGYGSARIVEFSSAGKSVLAWGQRGTGRGEFELPHNLVVDHRSRVYVTDRESRRIQVFDPHGKFLDQWRDAGSGSALYLTGDQRI